MKHFAIALCLAMPFAGSLQAGLVPETEPLAVTVQREPVDTIVPIYRAYMNVGSEKFAFMLPENFRLGGDAAHGRLLLENTQVGSTITLNFLHSGDANSMKMGREAYLEMLSSRYANGKVVNEFTRPAAGQDGLGFDVQWAQATSSGSNIVQRTRAIFLPTSAGLLEISVTTSVKNANDAESDLDTVLRSFAASVGGVLTVHHVGGVN